MIFEGEERECIPLEIQPFGIQISDYIINYNKDQDLITDVKHKHRGLVKFNTLKIEEDSFGVTPVVEN